MLRRIIITLLLNGVALYITVELLDEISIQGGIITFIYAALIVGILNTIVKPIISAVTFPVKFLTLGLSVIAVNIFMFYLADIAIESLIGPQYDVIVKDSLVTYIKAGILFGAINWIENLIFR